MLKKFILMALFLFLSTGCLMNVKDGMIPLKFISFVQPYMGTYKGNLDGEKSTLVLSLGNSGRIQLNILGPNGSMLSQCQTQIGKLKSISGDADKMTLNYAVFQFHADSNCGIEGRTLRLDFRGNGKIYLSIVEKASLNTFMCSSPYPPFGYAPFYGSGYSSYGNCTYDQAYRVDSWIRGIYSKDE